MDVQLRIPNATVYRSYELSLKSNEGSSCALASWNDSCSASHSSVMSRESLRRTLTVVVRRLLESLETFMEHLRVDINNFNGSFSVSMLFSCVIEDTKCNVSCSSGDIDATNWIFATGFQGRDKVSFQSLCTPRDEASFIRSYLDAMYQRHLSQGILWIPLGRS